MPAACLLDQAWVVGHRGAQQEGSPGRWRDLRCRDRFIVRGRAGGARLGRARRDLGADTAGCRDTTTARKSDHPPEKVTRRIVYPSKGYTALKPSTRTPQHAWIFGVCPFG